jgi:lactate permease
VVAIVLSIVVYKMPWDMAALSFLLGAVFGLLTVGWTIFNAMLLYNITVETGQFNIVRRSVAGVSGDARLQAILIAFAFGAFLEGAAGGGTPVAICGAIMVGLGFHPYLAAILCLIANTSPVAYGALGTPLITLGAVTDLPTETLSIMAGHQLPLLSLIVPLYMVKCMCSWRQTAEVWPALAVAGGSFALFQFTFATIHAYQPYLVLYPMTDIGGGIFSLIVSAVFLKFCWKPRHEWHFKTTELLHGTDGKARSEPPLTWRNVSLAWAPFALMSVSLLLSGLVRQEESRRPGQVRFLGIPTNTILPIPGLHQESYRDPYLHVVRVEEVGALLLAGSSPLETAVTAHIACARAPRPEKAEYNFAWLTVPGTPVLLAAVLSIFMLRMRPSQIRGVVRRTFVQMRIPIPTICFMLGLSYVTRYAGMDATLGYAFAQTGAAYPFFAAMLGWLGVFLTGTDAGSNALFGSLQKITTTEIFKTGVFHYLTLAQAQVLICTANSTGGVMGKMIDAQSICVATAATDQVGNEGNIFKGVVWHSLILGTVVGLLTLLQAYFPPLTWMVPSP